MDIKYLPEVVEDYLEAAVSAVRRGALSSDIYTPIYTYVFGHLSPAAGWLNVRCPSRLSDRSLTSTYTKVKVTSFYF